jgi:hypothetical protein
MMYGGTRGTWDRGAYYALRAAGRQRKNIPTPFHWNNRLLITTATPRAGYGMSTGVHAYLVHEVASVHLAWRGGCMVAAGVYWRCRAFTMTFRLLPGPAAPMCPLCQVQRIPRPRRSGDTS